MIVMKCRACGFHFFLYNCHANYVGIKYYSTHENAFKGKFMVKKICRMIKKKYFRVSGAYKYIS